MQLNWLRLQLRWHLVVVKTQEPQPFIKKRKAIMFVVMWIDKFNIEKFSTFRTEIENEATDEWVRERKKRHDQFNFRLVFAIYQEKSLQNGSSTGMNKKHWILATICGMRKKIQWKWKSLNFEIGIWVQGWKVQTIIVFSFISSVMLIQWDAIIHFSTSRFFKFKAFSIHLSRD